VTEPTGDAAAQRREDRAEAKVLRDDLATDAHARREDLAKAARELKKEVADLRGEVNNLNTRTQRAEKATFRSAVVIGFLLMLTLGLGAQAWQNGQTSDRLDALIAARTKQVDGAFCPFYQLILGSYDPDTRPLNPDGSYEGSPRQRYIDGFDGPHGLRDQYAALTCKGNLIPPRIPGS
jgi:hypothetical protein